MVVEDEKWKTSSEDNWARFRNSVAARKPERIVLLQNPTAQRSVPESEARQTDPYQGPGPCWQVPGMHQASDAQTQRGDRTMSSGSETAMRRLGGQNAVHDTFDDAPDTPMSSATAASTVEGSGTG